MASRESEPPISSLKYGGAGGSHWEGCEMQHWDCLIVSMRKAHAAESARLEREVQALMGECAMAYDVIDSLSEDQLAMIPEAKLFAACRIMEQEEKRNMAETSLQRQVSAAKAESARLRGALERIAARGCSWRDGPPCIKAKPVALGTSGVTTSTPMCSACIAAAALAENKEGA